MWKLLRLQIFFCLKLSAIKGIMAFFVTVIASDLGNIPILACLFFAGSSDDLGSRDTVFSSISLDLI